MTTTRIRDIFRRVPVQEIRDEQYYEAMRGLLEHEAAAEHHGALAEMYRIRAARLSPDILKFESAPE